MRIKTKILLPTIALTLLVTAAILLSNTALFSSFVDEATVEEVNVATKVAVERLDSLKAMAAAASMSIAEDYGIQSAIMNRNREELLAPGRSFVRLRTPRARSSRARTTWPTGIRSRRRPTYRPPYTGNRSRRSRRALS